MSNLSFDTEKYFKLVLGLGNCSLDNIEQLCNVYAQAGADIFDLSPNIKSLKAAQLGVKKAGLNPYDFKYCVSFGVKGDSHIKKAQINTKKCKRCYKCVSKCPQNAIVMGENGYPKVLTEKCIGCRRCEKSCIDFHDYEVNIKDTAKDFKGEKLDIVELHISSLNKKDIFKKWETILDNFDCQKSICIDRSKYGTEKLIKLVREMTKLNSEPTIIQADGVPMSGMESLPCTLQAIAHAQIYKDLNMPIFISGGTNSFTRELADKFEISYNGITIGSYARAIVKDAITCGDIKLAVEIAKRLVDNVKN
ncbi:4Fe-4S binding protein [bacterium]|nr:4Fe-4S binding protein [bacterium]